MDALTKVTQLSEQAELAEEQYKAALAARDDAIWRARTTRYEPDGPARYGPGVIAKAASLTPEHVRRICNAEGRKHVGESTD